MSSQIVEQLRWKKFPVLDQGFVCLVDVMGDDSSIVQAARVSYGDGTKKVSDDWTLIRYLMRHQHTTPFEMAEIKLLVRVPMDCWRQWIRHRTASVNEYSTRYSVAIDAAYATADNAWRMQSESNRQGSGGLLDLETGRVLSEEEGKLHTYARDVYNKRIAQGVAREQARKDLPLSTYTEAYWKVNLHNMFRFLALRMERGAQYEIRQYAAAIGEKIVQYLFPQCWEAFLVYQFRSIRLSLHDQNMIYKLVHAGTLPATREQFMAAQEYEWKDIERCRERDECYAKLRQMDIVE